MKFYLDEDLSPKIAQMLREKKIDCISAHEKGMIQASDMAQLEFAANVERCLVTKNRDDFIRLTLRFFNSQLPHHGVLIVPHSSPGDRFYLIVEALENYDQAHSEGMMPYTIDFLTGHAG